MMPKCPFFREPCLKEDCTAYQPTQIRHYYCDGQKIAGTAYEADEPYCHVLKTDLPVRKNKELPPTPETRGKFTP